MLEYLRVFSHVGFFCSCELCTDHFLKKEVPMRVVLFGMLIALAGGCTESNSPASAERPTADRSSMTTTTRTTTEVQPAAAAAPADRANTGINVRDSDSTTKTPLDQKENQADIATTADIRKRVVDTEMSVNAHNVKIITQDGKVTLRGPVKTTVEKTKIEELARAVAGDTNVDNQLDVTNE
ncbi:MAG: BON domain-containing protein [Pirellulaceae bacterium]